MRNVDLQYANLTNCKCDAMVHESCNFSFATLDDAVMSNSKLDACIMHQASAHRVQMLDLATANCSFDGTDFSHSDMTRSHFQKASFRNATFDSATLLECNLAGACLEGSRCSRANMQGCVMRQADLRRCTWISSSLRLCEMRGAKVGGANLSHSDLQQADVQGVVWNLDAMHGGAGDGGLDGIPHAAQPNDDQQHAPWARFESLERRKSGAEVGGVVLHGCKLTSIDMSGADLRKSDLTHANMVNAILLGVLWDQADLSHAVLTGARVSSLQGCVLLGAKLEAAVLSDCDFTDVPEFETADKNMRLAQLERVKAPGRVLRGFVLDRCDAVMRHTVDTHTHVCHTRTRPHPLSDARIDGLGRGRWARWRLAALCVTCWSALAERS